MFLHFLIFYLYVLLSHSNYSYINHLGEISVNHEGVWVEIITCILHVGKMRQIKFQESVQWGH